MPEEALDRYWDGAAYVVWREFESMPSVIAPGSRQPAVEWLQRGRRHPLDVAALPRAARWAIYLVLSSCLLLIGNFGAVEFIYFQF